MKPRYKPMLAKEVPAPFNGKDWLFEVKWDGFRAIAYINGGELSLRSRNSQDLKDTFPELAELTTKSTDAVLDGEIVILHNGKLDFQALLERAKSKPDLTASPSAVYVAFDILEKDGKSLIDLPLIERKRILLETVQPGNHVILADFVEEKGEAYYKVAMEKGLEGIIAKQKQSPYNPGARSESWLKIKKLHTADCVIFGYTQGTGVRKSTFGALLLGLYDDNRAVYVGKVGTGFSQDVLDSISERLRALSTQPPPFQVEIEGEVVWVNPELVCEVGYQVVTKEGRLRMPRFQRLRFDKRPWECTAGQLQSKPLQTYEEKRNFVVTTEPGILVKKAVKRDGMIFVVQEHHARRLHYDFRLEREGVLKSWAVPKGIPQAPSDKRLAVEVEDHPLEYADFEGDIPKGQYGAGKVVIWDKGPYTAKVWSEKMIEITLQGKRLNGRYVLVPLKRGDKKNWLMLKAKD